ncbi:MAG: MarR family transcriptional regulator [Betaproteobacteria bacterium]|nr:MarR family transcriptional regulator [Betaproteobacteria bacterium]
MTAEKTVKAGAAQRLKREISLNRNFTSDAEATFLSIVWTWVRIEKAGQKFFAGLETTDAQFNALMILWDYRGQSLRQHQLADLLVVNRASAGGIIDRMERDGLVRRSADPDDRRAQLVSITDTGIRKLEAVKRAYYPLIESFFEGIPAKTLATVLDFNEQIRTRLATVSFPGPQGKSSARQKTTSTSKG